jgi:hypothetical protein
LAHYQYDLPPLIESFIRQVPGDGGFNGRETAAQTMGLCSRKKNKTAWVWASPHGGTKNSNPRVIHPGSLKGEKMSKIKAAFLAAKERDSHIASLVEAAKAVSKKKEESSAMWVAEDRRRRRR